MTPEPTVALRRALQPLPGALVLAALLLLFVAERMVGDGPWRQALLITAGAVFLVGTGLRIRCWRAAPPAARQLGGIQLAGHAVLAVGAGLYARHAPLVASGDAPETAALLLIASLLAFGVASFVLLAVEFTAMPMRRAGFVETLRVNHALVLALVMAFALAGASFLNYAAQRKDVRQDLSYAAPTAPSQATVSLIEASQRDVEVFLFFEKGSPVLPRIRDYFDALAARGATVRVQDQALDAALTEALGVHRNGTIAYRSGERVESWYLGRYAREARIRIEELDQATRTRLAKITRDQAVLYTTSGHGELTEGRQGVGGRDPATRFNKLAEALNTRMRTLGAADGLVNGVPEDAAVVIIHGPQTPFVETEVRALIDYLNRGGSLLLLLEPGSNHGLDAVLDYLNLRLSEATLANDKQFVRQTHTPADHGFIWSRSFVSHRAVQSLNDRFRRGILLVRDSGYLERRDSDEHPAHPIFLARTRPGTFVDLDGNYQFDEGREQRGVFDILAAVERPVAEGLTARAIVAADSDILADRLLTNEPNAMFGLDATLWLLRDDQTSGGIEQHEDVPIRHTRDQDVLWFYGSTFAVPLALLGLGLGYIRLRRRPGARA